MMNGYKCALNIEVTAAMTEKAVARLENVAFVGLTEEWNDSICLFHAMFGGEMNPHSFQNVRSTNAFATGRDYQRDAATEQVTVSDDPHDWALYMAAKARYRQLQRKYGFPVYDGREGENVSVKA